MSHPIARAVGEQKRAALLALGMAAAGLWVTVPMGRWQLGVFLAVGVVLGFVNHVLTELSLRRAVDSGEMVTRAQFTTSALVRLIAVSFAAVAVTVLFWPYGAGALFGLALFRLIALILTGIPLLRELKKA